MHVGPGKFITFEGGEGSGKSTQIQLLKDHLQSKGYDVIVTREPGGTPDAEEIRHLLVNGDPAKWDAMTELLLMFAARRDHLVKKIWPAVKKGVWVLSDRFADSSMAYQGYAHGLGQEKVQALYDLVIGQYKPDLTLILDIDPKEGLLRAGARAMEGAQEDRFEQLGLSFHQKIREAFLTIAAADQSRCKILQANQSIEALSLDIIKKVDKA